MRIWQGAALGSVLAAAVVAAGAAGGAASRSATVGNTADARPAESPVAPGAKAVKLAEGFAFTEGSTSDKNGDVYFIDQPNNSILKWTFDGKESGGDYSGGKLSTFMHPSNYANGMSFDGQGNLIACADEKNELWSIAPDKKVMVLVKDYQGKLLNGPNDVWIRPDGNMYLTDPLYKRDWWKGLREPTSQLPGEYVFYLDVATKKLTPVITDFRKPNGIIGTPDGKTLYVSDIGANKTWSYRIQPDGTLADKKPFCDAGSDGMTIDSDGNVYVSNRGVTIFSKEGKRLDHIDTDSWVGNTCFGGKDGHTLFMAVSKSIYAIQMRTHGVGPA
ncbi:MAG TPA: SMP-30/gluconolactonase/LRE family protein [Phycisphaerae bacterium]|nr:SMP-30/gluconolactonase/LRE family protein [Phycisphaerae bacterium]